MEKKTLILKPNKAIIILFLIISITQFSLVSSAINDGLVAYYPLNETSGDAIDYALGNDADTTTNPTMIQGVPGKVGDAYNFTSGYLTGGLDVIPENSTYTVGVWAKPSSLGTVQVFASQLQGTVGRIRMELRINETGNIQVRTYQKDLSQVFVSSSTIIPLNEFTSIVGVRNSTHLNLYVNGFLEGSSIWDGTDINDPNKNLYISNKNGADVYEGILDEVRVWNRSLSEDEINQNYGLLGAVINSPLNDSSYLINEDITFNISTYSNQGLSNITMFIDGVLNETVSISGNNNETIFTKSFDTEEIKYINFEVCNNLGSCSQTENLSINIERTLVTGNIFSSSAYETSIEEYYVNISGYKNIVSLTAILNYNGSRYTSTESCSGSSCEVETAINIPLITQGSINPFVWEFQVTYSDDEDLFNSSTYNQNINFTILTLCNATYTTQSLNFTVFDESDGSSINPFSFESSIDFWLGSGLSKKNYEYLTTSTSSVQFCIEPSGQTFNIEGQVNYDEASGTNYTERNYYFQNDEITSTSQDIELGLLKSTDSTTFILVVQDQTQVPVEDVLIYIQRYYPGTNEYKTVQVAKTDVNGKTIGFFLTETVDYRFLLKQNASTVLLTNKQKIIPESVPYTITFTIGETGGTAWEGFTDYEGIESDITWNQTTGIVTLVYTDSTGNLTQGELRVVKVRLDELTNLEVCSTTSSLSASTLTCNISGNETGLYYAQFIATVNSAEVLIEQISITLSDFASELDSYGLFIILLVLIISSTAFFFNDTIGIVLMNIMLIGFTAIGFINLGGGFITSIVAMSIIVLIILNR